MSDEPKLPLLISLVDKLLIWMSLVFGGLTLVFMTGFSVWNVLIMRKAFNAPITGAEDLLILSLVVIVALSVALGSRTGAHIEIEVLESYMSQRFAKWSMMFVKLLGVGLLATMSWRLWHAGFSAERFGETTQQLLISYKPFYQMLSVSIAIYTLVLLLDIYQLLRQSSVVSIKIDSDIP